MTVLCKNSGFFPAGTARVHRHISLPLMKWKVLNHERFFKFRNGLIIYQRQTRPLRRTGRYQRLIGSGIEMEIPAVSPHFRSLGQYILQMRVDIHSVWYGPREVLWHLPVTPGRFTPLWKRECQHRSKGRRIETGGRWQG